MKVKTSELSGVQLDWAVAVAEGLPFKGMVVDEELNPLRYHNDWKSAGSIIEREGMSLEFRPMGSMHEWVALSSIGDKYAGGETPLIAAMRCYVFSELGEEVEVPDDTP